MFTCFHANKFFHNKKGQLVPFFIVVLVVLIIMAFVTVNLSKVALFKTESANAADAAGLAAGSVMANVFNGIAKENGAMETYYWTFYTMVSIVFVKAIYDLITANVYSYDAITPASAALSSACASPCSAIGEAAAAAALEAKVVVQRKKFVYDIQAIMAAIMAYSVAANYHYRGIRKMAEKGRESAIKMGHQFAFMNSNIATRLKPGKPPDDIITQSKKNNYRDEFSRFMDSKIGKNPEYTYTWEDDAGRQHSVRSRITIDSFNFKLKTTVMPWPAEIALLETATGWMVLFLYSASVALLAGACGCQRCCGGITAPFCCPCWGILCGIASGLLAVGIAANVLLNNTFITLFAIVIPAWAGLLPGPTVTSTSSNDMAFYTICWIEDVDLGSDHNRLVKVDVWQHHEGAKLGVWEARYPDTHSYCEVDFSGYGKIHPPELRFDADVVKTDNLALEPVK